MFGLVVVRFVWMVLIIHLGVFNDLHTFPINHMDSGCRTVMMFLYGDCGLSHEGSEYTSDYTPHDLLIHIRRSMEILTSVRRRHLWFRNLAHPLPVLLAGSTGLGLGILGIGKIWLDWGGDLE